MALRTLRINFYIQWFFLGMFSMYPSRFYESSDKRNLNIGDFVLKDS